MDYDYLVVGAGIIGMSIAYELMQRDSHLKIIILEKEEAVAMHASGRNSGVLHAGFYYTADSLKAKLTVDGNRLMKGFCKEHGIHVKETQKVVIAQDETELKSLYELKKRGDINGVETFIISQEQLNEIDDNIVTYKEALFSPTTASVNPKKVCYTLQKVLENLGVKFVFNHRFHKDDYDISYKYLINSAGLYADKIAHTFGVGLNYTMLPFKGIYLKSLDENCQLKINVYPVPNLNNPFLGVHFTITEDGSVKIGPTAIPALWRENYDGFKGFKIQEFFEIIYLEAKLFVLDSFNFRALALSEISNYRRTTFVNKAKQMLKVLKNNFKPMPAGIRAQLYDKIENKLEMDFIIKHTQGSTHVLNAVSPAFTCSFAFAKYVADEIEHNKEIK